MRYVVVSLLGIACSISAQTPAPSSAPKPASDPPKSSQSEKDLSKYDFNGALQVLRGQGANPEKSGASPSIPPLRTGPASAVTNASAASKPPSAPPDWRPPHVVLNATAASEHRWRTFGNLASTFRHRVWTVESCTRSGKVCRSSSARHFGYALWNSKRESISRARHRSATVVGGK